MKRRASASVLLEQEQYERIERRARLHGHTVSEEIREVIDKELAGEPANEGWTRLSGIAESATKPASWVDSDEFRDEFARNVAPSTARQEA